MDGRVSSEDIAAWAFHVQNDGPEPASCALAHSVAIVSPLEDFGYQSKCRYQFIARTNGLVGHKKYPKPSRERKQRTEEEKRAARLARNERYRNKAETRAKFYAWRNEHRRKKRAAGVPYSEVDRRSPVET